MTKYMIFEDTCCGLILFTFDKNGNADFAQDYFELPAGQLKKDIRSLQLGSVPAKEKWQTEIDTPKELYEYLQLFNFGLSIVADENGFYPHKMSKSAQKELLEV